MKPLELKHQCVIFEGVDASGKSSAVRAIKEKLETLGISCISTREPGGTPAAEVVREVLKYGVGNDVFGEKSTLTGMFTTRFHLHDALIKPSVEKGDVVLCDRFAGSSYAYQVCNNRALTPLFDSLMQAGDFIPHFTIFLDVTYEESCNRMSGRGEEMDAIEKRNAGEVKFNNLRNGIKEYLELYQRNSHLVIDTTDLSPSQVVDAIMNAIVK